MTMFRDAYIDPVVFVLGMASVGVGVAGVRWQEGRGEPEEVSAPVSEPRRVPNLNPAPNGFESIGNPVYESAVRTVKAKEKLDPRIKQWAWAVTYENTPMTQAKWCGKGKPFSKPAYVAFIYGMLRDKHITVINLKDPKSSYKPSGRQGREYIRDLAIGRTFRPFPTLDKSETDLQFLRAGLRRQFTEGEGRVDV
jgi:hypothetical protein